MDLLPGGCLADALSLAACLNSIAYAPETGLMCMLPGKHAGSVNLV